MYSGLVSSVRLYCLFKPARSEENARHWTGPRSSVHQPSLHSDQAFREPYLDRDVHRLQLKNSPAALRRDAQPFAATDVAFRQECHSGSAPESSSLAFQSVVTSSDTAAL